jgi:hypothetical protein
MNRDGNIWLGRAHGLTLKNQMLMIYGYVERYPEFNSTLAAAKEHIQGKINNFKGNIEESTQDDEVNF